MSSEQFFVKPITIESLVVNQVDQPHDEPQSIDVGRVDLRASMLRNGEMPVSADSTLAEMKSHMTLASQLSEMIDNFLSEYRKSTDQKIASLSQYGMEYDETDRRIYSEVQALQDSVVEFLVNSTHDKDIYLKVVELIEQVNQKITELNSMEITIREDRANYQIDIAQKRNIYTQRASQQYRSVQEVRRSIGEVEVETESVGIDSLDQFIDLHKGVDVVATTKTAQTTQLSDEERAQAQISCPELLKDYDEILLISSEAKQQLGAILTRDSENQDVLDKTTKSVVTYKEVRQKLQVEAQAAVQKIEKYKDKHTQMVSMIGRLNANLQIRSDYNEGRELVEYPSTNVIYTTRLSSDFSKYSDEDISKVGQSFQQSLEAGKVPDAATDNPYAEEILKAFQVTTDLKNQYKNIAQEITDDTQARITELESLYGQDATILGSHQNEISSQSGIHNYLLNLALSYDKSLQLLAQDRHEKEMKIAAIAKLDQEIELCEKQILATVSSAKIHTSNIHSSKLEIEQENADYIVRMEQQVSTSSTRLMKGLDKDGETPTLFNEQDYNSFMMDFEQEKSLPVDNLLERGRGAVDMSISKIQHRIDLDNSELDDCLALQKELQNKLIAQRDLRSNTIARIDDLSVQIMTHEHNIDSLINDGKYQEVIASIEVAVHMFKSISQNYYAANFQEIPTLEPETIRKEDVESTIEHDIGLDLSDKYIHSTVKNGMAKVARFRFAGRAKKAVATVHAGAES